MVLRFEGLMKSARESDIIKVILQNGEKTRSILKIQSDKVRELRNVLQYLETALHCSMESE